MTELRLEVSRNLQVRKYVLYYSQCGKFKHNALFVRLGEEYLHFARLDRPAVEASQLHNIAIAIQTRNFDCLIIIYHLKLSC